METMQAVALRRSVRRFSGGEVPETTVREILKAGMSAPSCKNSKDWYFIVVRDREKLKEMAQANGPAAAPLLTCAFAVLVCGDLERAYPPAKEYWVIDYAAAAENMLLAATDRGVGSVWLGTYPQQERVKKQAQIFSLAENLVPHSVLAFGYPESADAFYERESAYDPSRVRWE